MTSTSEIKIENLTNLSKKRVWLNMFFLDSDQGQFIYSMPPLGDGSIDKCNLTYAQKCEEMGVDSELHAQ